MKKILKKINVQVCVAMREVASFGIYLIFDTKRIDCSMPRVIETLVTCLAKRSKLVYGFEHLLQLSKDVKAAFTQIESVDQLNST